MDKGYCTREKIEKPVSAFAPSQLKRGKGRAWCTACNTDAARRVKAGLPATELTQRTCDGPGCDVDISDRNMKARFCSSSCNAKRWHADHPGHRRAYVMKCVYGLTQPEFEEMLDAQGGVCAVCGGLPPEVDGKYGQWNVDHCHVTGRNRGILCSPCNTGIGMLGDSIPRLRAAIDYLERSEAELPRAVSLTP